MATTVPLSVHVESELRSAIFTLLRMRSDTSASPSSSRASLAGSPPSSSSSSSSDDDDDTDDHHTATIPSTSTINTTAVRRPTRPRPARRRTPKSSGSGTRKSASLSKVRAQTLSTTNVPTPLRACS